MKRFPLSLLLVATLSFTHTLASAEVTAPNSTTTDSRTNKQTATNSVQQNYHAQFNKHFEAGNYPQQLQVLQQWEKQDSKDAQFYIDYFNYYINKDIDSVVEMNQESPDSDALVAVGDDGEPVLYLSEKILYDKASVKQGIAKLDQGIARYPNRLDMRLGKIYVLAEVNDWDNFTQEIITLIHDSKANHYQWLVEHGEPLADAEEYILFNIQGYQNRLFHSDDKALLNKVKQIANAVIKAYPNDVRNFNNLASTYTLNEEYEKGLTILLKAEKIAPSDPVILMNIANSYAKTNRKQQAIDYYQKVVKLDIPDAKAFAQEKIAELQK